MNLLSYSLKGIGDRIPVATLEGLSEHVKKTSFSFRRRYCLKDTAGESRTVQNSAGQCREEYDSAAQSRTKYDRAGQCRTVHDTVGHAVQDCAVCRTVQN